ncbi:2-oxoglutarate dehydrogenase E1 component [Lignipirellula cremea]|uniref:oxoglutarate dehydrogenase (succinyl-transferring) n=1 Tax=Lignipirellula cremea TaxID=2528010 RepID=A0A518DT31_9BACT|nr:2-oxoglutarate dehydrogenase E1 component [Lignipirellula cremea]QDU94999.1 2-oxoglutarate dehydrogenase E1 component [Lignipirellula cremea]
MHPQSVEYVERLFEAYRSDPSQVSPAWKRYFDDLTHGAHTNGASAKAFRPTFRPASVFNPASGRNGADTATPSDSAQLQDRVDQLVRAYRARGHYSAKLDPLGFKRTDAPDLSLRKFQLSDGDLDRTCSAAEIGGPTTQSLRQIVDRMRKTYCRYIGVQFMHVSDSEARSWLQLRMESTENRIKLSHDQQWRILKRLTEASVFEEFVRKKYVGSKTFSLEGAESLIPLLDLAIDKASQQGVAEVVMGMAHRGRLNVLANIIGKPPLDIFWEFEDSRPDLHYGRGDVKYHLGYSGDWKSATGQKVHLSLCFNPSHLEFVNTVALGRVRAKQDQSGDTERRRGMSILIHGDAAFAGEGVVQETLNLSQLEGYSIGGTLHVIVNNQIGFTTSPTEARSTQYASDIAKMLQIPIFHVNGEHPAAVAQVVDLAMDFRERFRRDVVINMYCYRRWGHNESDEPSFTQPLLYGSIEKRESVREGFLKHLLKWESITREDADRLSQERHEKLEQQIAQARDEDYLPEPQAYAQLWKGFLGGEEPADDEPNTGVKREQAALLLNKLSDTPEDFHLHPKLERLVELRREMARDEKPLDWSAAEALALASLSVDGYPIRISGQDSQRGTFSQRHAVLHDVETGRPYNRFQHLSPNQASFEIVNSPLSEIGVLGFEYGYSLDRPRSLVAWEAQFGDFLNVAQAIVDQFISSAEDKWRRLSGLILLLPHGFEGMGPEHSSARLERFLVMAAEHNMQIMYPSTPAQYFHALRRQTLRKWRKPLVILTPKSLLRHPAVTSTLDEIESGGFQRVIADQETNPAEVERVLLCSGKIYYDLDAYRIKQERRDTAIVRIEQFYPVPEQALEEAMSVYADDTPVYWVQEEPENMGANYFWKARYGPRLLGRFPFGSISRVESASPATGSHASHKREQQELVEEAFER